MRLRFAFALSALASTLIFSVAPEAQTPAGRPAETAIALHPDLLPLTGFGDWKAAGDGAAASEPSFSLVTASKNALEECGPQRSAVQNYTNSQGRTLHVEAVELRDVSGALAAFSILSQPGMHPLAGLGSEAAAGEGGILFMKGASVAAVFPATASDLTMLQSLASTMPTVSGSQALRPLLPTLLPERGLVAGSVRYALGSATYLAGGGTLPAASLGWDKDVEAVTAKYNDRRGAETLTLLLYPTPTIAGPHLRTLDSQLPGLGPAFAHARSRREGQLVIVANGTFSADAAQALTENTHIHQLASTDKAMVTPDVVETRKTFGLLANIIVFSGILCAGALLLGLFLGGGRALVRVLRGKPAATESEFLSLHLDPQNPTPIMSKE